MTDLFNYQKNGITSKYAYNQENGLMISSNQFFEPDYFHMKDGPMNSLINIVYPGRVPYIIPRACTYDGTTWTRPWGDVVKPESDGSIPGFTIKEIRKYLTLILGFEDISMFESIVDIWKNGVGNFSPDSPRYYFVKGSTACLSVEIPSPSVLLALVMTKDHFVVTIPGKN